MKVIVTSKIDPSGRIFIPSEVRKILNLKPGDSVCYEISKAGALVIRKVEKKVNEKE